MRLCDAGPLVALSNPREVGLHARCAAELTQLKSPLITTWACLAEAFHITGRIGGWPCQETLWNIIDHPEAVEIHVPWAEELTRIRELMRQYRNVPMDLADATLVAAAESRRLRKIFTLLDSDFVIYRTGNGDAFEIVPTIGS